MNSGLLQIKLFAIFSWLLLFAAITALASTGYEVYRRHIAPQGEQQFSFSVASGAAQKAEVGLDEIVNRHIFGVVPVVVKEPVKVEPVKVVEAPKTQLNLKLAGVVAANDSFSMAMVEIKRGETGVVQVGDEIGETGAVLNAVFPDHILIEHRGKLEKLSIERETLNIDDAESEKANTISALNINAEELAALESAEHQQRLQQQRQQQQLQRQQQLQQQQLQQEQLRQQQLQQQQLQQELQQQPAAATQPLAANQGSGVDDEGQLTSEELLQLEEILQAEQQAQ